MTQPDFLPPDFLTDEALRGVPHGFFTRNGGVSAGGFATLNCSLSGADDPAAVRENRARAARALGLEPGSLSGLHQVHGVEVAVARAPIPPGQRPRADGIVTDRTGVALGIITADCGPVLFADVTANGGRGVVGGCHAGWRGAVAGVLEATVAAMEGLGARRERIAAVLGPCIRQPSYEVGPDLREELLAAEADGERWLVPGAREGRWQFDMAGLIVARLARLGLAHAGALPHDTLAEEGRFFSHRRRTLRGEGPIGHQISIIALPR